MSYSTKQREILLEFFNSNHDKSFTAQEIAEKTSSKDISQSAIYRNISTLEKSGKLRKTTKKGSHTAYYQYVDEDCENHVHISCTKCGKTEHLTSNDESQLIKNVLKNSSFELNTNETILYGICKDCKK